LFPELAYRSPRKTARASAAAAPGLVASASAADGKAAKRQARANCTAALSTCTVSAAIAPARVATAKCWNWEDRTSGPRVCGGPSRLLLSVWSIGCHGEDLSRVLGKRGGGSLEWVPATSTGQNETRASPGMDALEYLQVTFSLSALPPLRYFRVFIGGYPLMALVDSGSSRTILGDEGIGIVRRLGLPTTRVGGSRIRTANGQVAEIAEEITLSLVLENFSREVTVCLLPNLAVSCIVGMDFLCAFDIGLDFATGEWYFISRPWERRSFENLTGGDGGVYCGLSELAPAEEARLREFLATRMPKASANPGVTSLAEHRINVRLHSPIKQRCYLVSPKVQEAIRDEVDKMLAAGIIEPSYSEWSNPIVMVKKPNGKYRFCLDFRKVNGVSKKDAYPLPNMNGILDKLRSARYISTIDLSQAYFQIPLAKDSREITAFSVPGKGLYHFTRMPYGLTGAPATFQRLLDKLIGPEMEPHAFAYLDDIVVVTSTFEEHLEWLDRVLSRISAAELTINPEKCEFCRSQVRYLGFIVQRDGLTVDSDKVKPILEYPAPRNLKQLRRFLGMSSWYRRFVPQFATVSEPLTRLLKKNQRWEWGVEQEDAFEQIRARLLSAPTLSCPDFEVPFVLQTDASSVGLGAVLTQIISDTENVIAFASRALSDPEKKYSVTEQECLAVVWAIKKFRPYLEGYQFTVITDHSSLRWLHHLKNPTGRLARWALELLEYDYEIVHRKGALHHVPDALSRMFERDTEVSVMAAVDAELPKNVRDPWYCKRYREVSERPETFTDWKIVDEQLYYLKPRPTTSSVVADLNEWKLVLPSEMRGEALHESHDEPQSGHLGVDKTYQRLAIAYYWPNMFRTVAKYVRECDICQRVKVEQASPAGLMGRRVVEAPWTVVAADIMGPLPRSKSGFAYILVMQDLFTKWIECQALRVANGQKIRETIEDFVLSRWGTPRFLLTDNGTEFINRTLRAFAQEHGIIHTTVPPYHPQANPVERVNRVLKTMIIAFLEQDHREWDVHLRDFRFAYNTAHHSSIGASPAFVNLGRELEPVHSLRRRGRRATEVQAGETAKWAERMEKLQSLHAWVAENLEQAHRKQASYY